MQRSYYSLILNIGSGASIIGLGTRNSLKKYFQIEMFTE